MAALELPYGYVTGRFVHVLGDTSADADRLPDAVPAPGTVLLEPVRTIHVMDNPIPTTAIAAPVSLGIDTEGYVLDPSGNRGAWVIAGQYRVTTRFLSATIPPYVVEVTAAHTETAPLDLTLAAPATTPPSPVPYWQAVTQAQYDAMPHAPGTVYLIVEG